MTKLSLHRMLAAALVLGACGSCGKSMDANQPQGADAAVADAADAAVACPTFNESTSPGKVEFAEITEASGIVASRKTAGVLFVHNDSGDMPRVFAMTTLGKHRAVFSLSGASAVDWEDMAVGPGPDPGEHYLYLGDIGDNNAVRPSVVVYRVAEPSIPSTPTTVALAGVESFTFTYPGGARDAEALLIDPESGDLFILQKASSGPSNVYRKAAPLSSGELELVTSVDVGPKATAGDISPSGAEILIRTYNVAWLFRRAAGQTVGEALQGEPCSVPLHGEPQGEAIGFAADGASYFTVSEGVNQPLFHFVRN